MNTPPCLRLFQLRAFLFLFAFYYFVSCLFSFVVYAARCCYSLQSCGRRKSSAAGINHYRDGGGFETWPFFTTAENGRQKYGETWPTASLTCVCVLWQTCMPPATHAIGSSILLIFFFTTSYDAGRVRRTRDNNNNMSERARGVSTYSVSGSDMRVSYK